MNTEKQMQKAMESLDNRLLNIRAGRANPAILNKVKIDYYHMEGSEYVLKSTEVTLGSKKAS